MLLTAILKDMKHAPHTGHFLQCSALILVMFLLFFTLKNVDAATDQLAPTESEVLVVYNSSYVTDSDVNLMQDSRQIAEYYQTKRPGVTVTSFAMPLTEEITWAQYNTLIKAPLETYLTTNNLDDVIKIIVTVKGVPLKIMGDEGFHDPWGDPGCEPFCPVNYASVDAGITLSYQDFKSTTRHTNAYYNTDPNLVGDNHFKLNYFTTNGFTLRYLVSRLDGYSLSDVLGMIDRGTDADMSNTGYWVLDSSATMNFSGYASARTKLLNLNKNVIFDPYPGSIYITTSVNPIMGYSSFGYLDNLGDGYVSNNPVNVNHLDFDLLNGSVMSTWESFNAWGFQNADQHYHGQIGEWISIGGSGGIGNVYEPYTTSLSREEIWMPSYAMGYPWVEAAYMSMPKMGYVQTVLGDPLMIVGDNIDPSPVSGFSAVGQDSAIQLSWTNPGDPDFVGVKVIRKLGSYPTTVADGTQVYDGAGTSYLNSGLSNGVTYYYAAFAYDVSINYSAIALDSKASTYPRDNTIPSSVTGVQVVTGTGLANLHWDNPASSDLWRVIVMRKVGSYPENTSDGNQQYIGLAEAFLDVGLSTGIGYYYAIFAQDTSFNYSLIQSDSRITVTLAQPPSGGGGGGGGGGSPSISCSAITYGEWETSCINNIQRRTILSSSPSFCTLSTAQQTATQRACTSENPVNQSSVQPDILLVIADDLKNIETNNFGVFNSEKEFKVLNTYKNIIERDQKLSIETKAKIVRFISYGLSTTSALGEGERAGVLNSYFQAFKKMPDTSNGWSDLLKIAQGRWPNERNTSAEAIAHKQFKKIYGRVPDLKRNVDENAIMVMSYGLLPSQRNLKSEQAAIKSYRWIYGTSPRTAEAWNIVRAIAYSGAKR